MYNVRNSKTELTRSNEKRREVMPKDLSVEFDETDKMTSVKAKVLAKARDEKRAEIPMASPKFNSKAVSKSNIDTMTKTKADAVASFEPKLMSKA